MNPPISLSERKVLKQLKGIINTWGQDARIRKIAASIVTLKGVGGDWIVSEKDHIGTINAVYHWVDQHVKYVCDPKKIDVFEDPLATLDLKVADCDGYLILVGSLLQAIGYPVAVVMTSQSKSKPLSHVYLLVGIPPLSPPKVITEWIPIDAITDEPITWQPPYAYGIWSVV